MNRTRKRTAAAVLISVVIIVLALYFLQRLLMPKYMTDVVEGAMVAEYYDEEKDHDVIFIGDCELSDGRDIYL